MSSTEVVPYVSHGEVVFDSPPWEYLYVNIAKHIATCVVTARLEPGQRLPSEAELAEYYGVSKRTQRRAMQHLRKHGLIVTLVGRGTFISPHLSAGDNALVEAVEQKNRELQ